MQELWKDIDGFENYQISNYGKVKSKERLVSNACRSYLKPEQILKTHVMKCGYLAVVLRDSEQKKHLLKVHRLVAEHFIPNPNGLPQVNHIDGDKTNSNFENLEWCTPKQNTNHAIENGLRKKYTGRNIQKVYQIKEDTKEIIRIHDSFADAARHLGCKSVGSIYAACETFRGYGGYYWLREEDYFSGGLNLCKNKRNVHRILHNGILLNAKQYAEETGISKEKVYEMLKTGELKDSCKK